MDPKEVAQFSAWAREWWDPNGKFGVLHRFNPLRLAFIRDEAARHFVRDAKRSDPLAGLTALDIGCGGGLLAEPLTRMGAQVTAIDPIEGNIKTASVHAEEQNLAIDYRAMTAESLAETGVRFDIVLSMEVIEHVADLSLYMKAASDLMAPGGLAFVATINRTLKAFALAIVGAEYILGWLPRGTHRWEKFVTPHELEAELGASGLNIAARTGIVYSPISDAWSCSSDMDVNYMIAGAKPAS